MISSELVSFKKDCAPWSKKVSEKVSSMLLQYFAVSSDIASLTLYMIVVLFT